MIRKIFALGLTACLSAATLAPEAGAQALESILVSSSVSFPIAVMSPPGDATNRLFVVEHGGRIRIIDDGVLLATDFLNISSLITGGGFSEQGLLGMAFHPDYGNNGFFYVSYSDTSGRSMLRRYTVSGGNPDVASATSGVNIYGPITQPFSNHNGGCIAFGGDGMLYLGLGDGGSGGDPGDRAQDLDTPLGKMLRFDVDIASPYIPASNPYAALGVAGLDEIWAFGLRNPWRFSFDRDTGDMWIGDVGQGSWEEIDFAPASSTGGEDYGWRCREGNHNFTSSGGSCNSGGYVDPVHEYGHGGGNCSITGGYVARGPLLPNFDGRYFFADYCVGDLKSIDPANPGISTNHDSDVSISGNISSFGEDANGDLYVVVLNPGRIYRLQEECTADVSTYCPLSPNSVSSGALISMTGTGSVVANDMGIACSNLPTNQPGLFFYGDLQTAAPFGQGTICVGGINGVFRIKPAIWSSFLGTVNRGIDLTQEPFDAGNGQVLPGSTWNFQY